MGQLGSFLFIFGTRVSRMELAPGNIGEGETTAKTQSRYNFSVTKDENKVNSIFSTFHMIYIL